MRRRLLPAVVLLALAGSLGGAFTAPLPVRLPAVALGAVVVWRAEVTAALFAASYCEIVALRLALHGETLTRVGRDGIEVPRVGAAKAARQVREDELAAQALELHELVEQAAHPRSSDDPIIGCCVTTRRVPNMPAMQTEPTSADHRPEAEPTMDLDDIFAKMRLAIARLETSIARAQVSRLEEQLAWERAFRRRGLLGRLF